MDWIRFGLAALGALVIGRGVTAAVLFQLGFKKVFDEKSPAFRPEGEERWGVLAIGYVSWALVFSYLFGRLLPSGGLVQGLAFGALAWGLYFFPMATAIYATFGVTRKWTASTLIIGAAECLVAGLVAGLVYGWGRG